MSYPIRVQVAKSVEEVVSAADRIVKKITLRPILPVDIMKDVLAKTLEQQGWKPASPGTFVKTGADGTVETFDLESMTLTAQVESSGKIERSETVEAHGDMDYAPRGTSVEEAREQLRRKTEKELEERLRITDEDRARRRRELEIDAADRLAAGEGERQREWNEVERQVYVEALKAKARQIGSVQDVSERESDDGGSYELEITIMERGGGPSRNARSGTRSVRNVCDDEGFAAMNRRRVRLINERARRGISPAEEAELEGLEARTSEYINARHPLPIDRLEADIRRAQRSADAGGPSAMNPAATRPDRRGWRGHDAPPPVRRRAPDASPRGEPRGGRETGFSRGQGARVTRGWRGPDGVVRGAGPRDDRPRGGRMGFRAADVSFQEVARALIADDHDFVYDVAVASKVLVPDVRRQRWFVETVADALQRRYRDPDRASRDLLGS